MGCKPGAHRRNSHNECLRLRALLKLAYRALIQNRCVIPKELVTWMRAQKQDIYRAGRNERLFSMTVDMVQQELVGEGFDGEDI